MGWDDAVVEARKEDSRARIADGAVAEGHAA